MHRPASPRARTSVAEIHDSATEMTVTAGARRIRCRGLVLAARGLNEEPMGRGVESGSEAGG